MQRQSEKIDGFLRTEHRASIATISFAWMEGWLSCREAHVSYVRPFTQGLDFECFSSAPSHYSYCLTSPPASQELTWNSVLLIPSQPFKASHNALKAL